MAKKSDLVVADHQVPDVTTMPTADLRRELARGLTLTAETLYRLGLVWQELERRGEDLSDLRHGMARTLPLIAAGLLAAEAVVAFAGRPVVLRALEGVPLDEQRRLAAGGPVRVIDPTEPGREIEMPLATMPAVAIRLAIDGGEIRTPDAQRLALQPHRRRRKGEDPGYRYRPRYDAETGTVAVGRMTVRLDDLLRELAAAAGPDRPPADIPEEYDVLRVRLSHEEFQRLQAVCRHSGLPDWEMARKALRAFGLI